MHISPNVKDKINDIAIIIYKPKVELDNGGRITPNVTPAPKVNQRNKDNNIGR